MAREGDRVGVSVLKYMELKDYTEEQLRAELKRRYDERQKEEIGISWFDDFEIRFRKAMEE